MLEPGSTVRILAGPFRDFVGTVTAVDREREAVHLTINFYGRDIPVELDFSEV
jgi:transcriptional antiterminator NusG